MPKDIIPHPARHVADARIRIGAFEAQAHVEITSVGLLAIGALVSGIILSVAPLVWTATNVARRRVAAKHAEAALADQR